MGEENVKIIDDAEVNILMTSGDDWEIFESFYVSCNIPNPQVKNEVEKELETKPYVYVKDEESKMIYRLCAYRRD